MNNNIKSLFYNFVKNMMAYAVPVAVLQFVIQPLIAKQLGEEKNGLFLTIIALNYFITNITASVLLQTRLLQNEKYKSADLTGDYNPILFVMALLNSIVISVGTWLYMGADVTWLDIILCIIISLLFLIHDYICVQYRVDLNYTRILISNLVLCVGYGIGCVIYLWIFPYWQIVFIVAYLLCEVYDLTHTTYLRESFRTTPLLSDTLKRYFVLAGSGLLLYLVSYGDRLLLYPVMAGSAVSVLTSAEIMGKMMLLISSPLSSFLLSYIVRQDSIKQKIEKKYIVLAVFGLVLLYVTCCLISVPILKLLYPNWANRALYYVPWTTLTSLINLIASVANVVIIRFAKSKWQVVISGGYLAIYLIASFALLHFFGLIGFCIGNLIAAIIKIVMIVWVAKIAIFFKDEA